MPHTDPRVDAYLARQAEFARPILEHLRKLVHKAHPDIEETIKWNMPYFTYRGRPLCMMAAFKAHAVFGFWDAAHMKDAKKLLTNGANSSMGHFGRITSKKDLPPDRVLTAYLKEAIALNEAGVKTLPNKSVHRTRPSPSMPAYFKEALTKNPQANAGFDKLPPSHRREYLLWFEEAKTEATRDRRVAQALEWIAAGKPRNWKYQRRA
ncbi:MAG: YdeI/OmpD-associated family protein [Myxococcaceae bacterium]|nr:YdeI/OmpD-associated family protein [Myxococcaceae bacterium]